jgi:osmotically-inducible protein OsmY
MSADFLVSSITDELFWDPSVSNSDITVSSDWGDVTLSGTVGTHQEARDAENAAKRVLGVTSVDNRLRVRSASSSSS